MNFFNFLILFLVFSDLFCQVDVTIQVTDEKNLGISNVEIYVPENNQHLITSTNGLTKAQFTLGSEFTFYVIFDGEIQKIFKKRVDSDQLFIILNENFISLNEVSIISSRWESDKLTSSNTLNLGQIKNKADVKDLPYLLQSQASVQVQSEAGNGVGYTGFRIRGIDPNQVQVNLNGIPLNDQESSRTYFVNTPDLISNSDRIDILSGFVPGRAGTGGFGAAVDIHLNTVFSEAFAELKTQMGSFNTSLWSLNLHSGLLKGKYLLEGRLSQQKSNGFIERSASDLKGLFLSGAIVHSHNSVRINYIDGEERTGQAWFGLPYSYFNVDSLVRFNIAGREKSGVPYPDEVDQYNQKHLQVFYHQEMKKGINLVINGNYTKGYGYYENYKAGAFLLDYGLTHPTETNFDLVRRKWLDNHYAYVYMGLDQYQNLDRKYSYGLSFSHYNGRHFGRVNSIGLEEVSGLGHDYYSNKGLKSELALFAKTSIKLNDNCLLLLDGHGRFLNYRINGKDDRYGNLGYSRNFLLLNPKTAFQYKASSNLHFSASASYYQREPYREDVLSSPAVNKEHLLDFEAGGQFEHSHFNFKFNFYRLQYFQYLALTGALNETGDPLRVQIPRAGRTGIELNLLYKVLKCLTLSSAANFSANKAGIFTETIPHYGAPENAIPAMEALDRNLAFSPDWLLFTGLEMKFGELQKKFPLILNYHHKWVGSQYLDLSSTDEAKLPAYHIGILRMAYTTKWKKLEINGFVMCYNLWDKKYSTHGWFSRFTSDEQASPDPYLGSGTNGTLFYKGLYPQALRHYTIGILLRI
ncbi:MAG: TonB-dependent receptor plug domain-containing protein [Saprospiraceae bacterium]|nr:TonB-dependent receptor plug domain-containing protein [Saprospiraceae bacterium]